MQHLDPEAHPPLARGSLAAIIAWTIIILATFAALASYVKDAEGAERDQSIRSFAPNYFLLDGDGNAKYQVSVAYKALNGQQASWILPDTWIVYEQQSLWDLAENSSPFATTDYQPRAFFSWGTGLPYNFISEIKLGYVHQSNGESGPDSRSWQRFFAETVFKIPTGKTEHIALYPQVWYVSATESGNSDIRDVIGDGKLVAAYDASWGRFAAEAGFGLSTPTLFTRWQLDIAHKIPAEWIGLYGYVQYFEGYGETLVDYNQFTSGARVGLLISH